SIDPPARSARRCRHRRVTAKYLPSMLPMAYGPAPVTAPGGRSATGHTVICFAMPASRQPPTVLSTSLSTRLGPHVGKHPQNAPGDTFISSSQADVERGGQHGGAVAAGAFTEHLVEHLPARKGDLDEQWASMRCAARSCT